MWANLIGFSFISNVMINENGMEDLVAWADIIGTVAGILVLSSFIPQIIKALQNKKDARCVCSSDDPHSKRHVSLGYLWFYQIRSGYNWSQCHRFCPEYYFVGYEDKV